MRDKRRLGDRVITCGGVAALGLALVLTTGGTITLLGQTQALPDAEIEANVLRALAAVPSLANQPITTTTVFGTVTLTGSASDDAARTLAENTAARAIGVKKVVDELTLGAATSMPVDAATAGAGTDAAGGSVSGAAGEGEAQGTAPLLQSDGTLAPADGGSSAANTSNPVARPGAAPDAQPVAGSAYPPVGADGRPVYRRPYDPSAPPAPAGEMAVQNGPQGNGPQGNGPRGQYGSPAYGSQVAGRPVTIPSGALVRIRINEGLSSKQVQPGSLFDGIVLNDVVADGQVAIPRGAAVQGTVVQAKAAGALAGKGQLALELNQVTLGGVNYPIVTDNWGQEGPSKTGESVGNAVGLGAFGAVLGAVFGGGPGALLGAAAGGGAGLATSAASGSRQVIVPAEAILTFHTVQPAPVRTVSEAEMNRLAGSIQPARQLRRYPPPPPPGYYPQPYYPYSY